MVANFEQYGLTQYYGDVIVCDFSRAPWRPGVQFDCVITDPPYGIREGIQVVSKSTITRL